MVVGSSFVVASATLPACTESEAIGWTGRAPRWCESHRCDSSAMAGIHLTDKPLHLDVHPQAADRPADLTRSFP